MLGDGYHWIMSEDGNAYLRFRYSGVASVRACTGGGFEVSIHYNGRDVYGKAASRAQGVRYVSRWIAARDAGHGVRCGRTVGALRVRRGENYR